MTLASKRRYRDRLRSRHAELMTAARERTLSAPEKAEFAWLARRCADLDIWIDAKEKEREREPT